MKEKYQGLIHKN